MRISDRVVLITGASEGIGAALAESFRNRGAKLALVARNRDRLVRVAGRDGLAIAGDLLDPETRQRAVAQTVQHYGRLDILVNNAGVGVYEPAHLMNMDTARQMWELNFFAPLELAQLAAVGMKQRGEGAIVNISSIVGKVTVPWFTMYSSSKHAVNSLTEGLRMELGPRGIHCMSVCPGYVRTRFQLNVLSGSPPPLDGLRAKWAVSAKDVAEQLCFGLERDARTVITPRSGWLFVAAARLFPGLMEAQLTKIYSGLKLQP